MTTPAPAPRSKSGPKPASFQSRQQELFARWESLRKVCIALAEEADPQIRAHLLAELARARFSGTPTTDGGDDDGS